MVRDAGIMILFVIIFLSIITNEKAFIKENNNDEDFLYVCYERKFRAIEYEMISGYVS